MCMRWCVLGPWASGGRGKPGEGRAAGRRGGCFAHSASNCLWRILVGAQGEESLGGRLGEIISVLGDLGKQIHVYQRRNKKIKMICSIWRVRDNE